MRSDSVGTHALMWTSLNKVSGHSLLAERPAGFQSVKSFNKDEAAAVAPDENGRLLADGQHALGNRNHLLWIEGLAPLDRHIDVEDGEGLRLQHRLHPFIARPRIPGSSSGEMARRSMAKSSTVDRPSVITAVGPETG